MKCLIIIQARMQSVRLPGKIFKKVLGKELLRHQLERLEPLRKDSEIVIATTINPADDLVAEFAKQNAVPFFRGSETDVLRRYYETAIKFKADIIVRLTSDCPLIDPQVVKNVIEVFKNGNFDYVSNTLERTFPRGMDTEVFTLSALATANNKARKPSEREHVTSFIYNNPETFKLANFAATTDSSQYRLTVDTPEDFLLIEKILLKLTHKKSKFTLEDILDLLVEHPELAKINQNVEQKLT